jgi:hypothetical protein
MRRNVKRGCVGLVSGPERPHLDVLARIGENPRAALERLLLTEPGAALDFVGIPQKRGLARRGQFLPRGVSVQSDPLRALRHAVAWAVVLQSSDPKHPAFVSDPGRCGAGHYQTTNPSRPLQTLYGQPVATAGTVPLSRSTVIGFPEKAFALVRTFSPELRHL